jgi:hypothetical protein
VAQADAYTDAGKERPHTLGGAVEAIGEHPFNPVRRLLVGRRTLKHPIGLGKGRRTGLLRVAEMPDHAATDNRGQIHLGGETAAVLLVNQEIDGERQTALGQHGHQTLASERTDETIQRQRRDMADDGTQFQTETTVSG